MRNVQKDRKTLMCIPPNYNKTSSTTREGDSRRTMQGPYHRPKSPRGHHDRQRQAIQSPSPLRVRGEEITNPVAHLDILNYEIAHLIRHETAEGHTVVEFLIHIMTGRDRPFRPKKFRIKPADRMAAARELLRRGFGDLGSRRRLSDTDRRSKRLRHPAHRPRQAYARVQRARQPTPSVSC